MEGEEEAGLEGPRGVARMFALSLSGRVLASLGDYGRAPRGGFLRIFAPATPTWTPPSGSELERSGTQAAKEYLVKIAVCFWNNFLKLFPKKKLALNFLLILIHFWSVSHTLIEVRA